MASGTGGPQRCGDEHAGQGLHEKTVDDPLRKGVVADSGNGNVSFVAVVVVVGDVEHLLLDSIVWWSAILLAIGDPWYLVVTAKAVASVGSSADVEEGGWGRGKK